MDTSDDWLAARRQYKEDICNDKYLLKREMLRFDKDVRKVAEEFWILTDEDGSNSVSREYVLLNRGRSSK